MKKGREVSAREIEERRRQCNYKPLPRNQSFKLIELALEYPQSLNDALAALPFRARVQDFI